MTFVEYCIATKNYSAIKNIKDYVKTKSFAIDDEDTRMRRKVLLGGAAGAGAMYLLGKHSGSSDTNSEINNALVNYVKKHGPINDSDDVARFMNNIGDYESGKYDPDGD